jgi:hypothetical protein
MAIGIQKRNLRSYEFRKHRYKQRAIVIGVIGIVLLIALGAFAFYQIVNRKYSDYQVVHTTKRQDSDSARYVSYGSGVLKYSKDGATAMDSAGNLLWSGSYEMKDPIVDICEKYVTISDKGYKTIQIYDGTGGVSTINVNYPIVKTEVANQGVIAVLMDGAGVNYIELYSKDSKEGESLVDIRTVDEDDGYPLDITLSNDATKLVTSYVTMNNGSMQNKITCYNFDEVGQNKTWRIVGAYDYGTTFVPDVQFVNNDTFCIFGDNKFSIYSMKEIPELIKEEPISQKIKSVFYNEKYIGLVLNSKDTDEKRDVLLYDLKGNKIFDKETSFEYANIMVSGNELLLYSDLEWMIWRIHGKEKLDYTFGSSISYIYPVNNVNKYIVIDASEMKEIRLIGKK